MNARVPLHSYLSLQTSTQSFLNHMEPLLAISEMREIFLIGGFVAKKTWRSPVLAHWYFFIAAKKLRSLRGKTLMNSRPKLGIPEQTSHWKCLLKSYEKGGSFGPVLFTNFKRFYSTRFQKISNEKKWLSSETSVLMKIENQAWDKVNLAFMHFYCAFWKRGKILKICLLANWEVLFPWTLKLS